MSANRLKLNMDKTVFVYEALSLSLSQDGGGFPSLQLVSMSEYWLLFSRPNSVLRRILPTSARPASTIFVSFDTSGVHSVQSLCYDTGACLCDVPGRLLTSCSECWTRQLVWLLWEVRPWSEAADTF